ncbi:unnamed protein product [Dicrocoelium dendriticum]|nr:unnamed protein product [Dicrocoelium dendriticum]
MTLNFIQAPFSEIERYLIYDLLGPNQMGEVECAKLAEVLWETYTNLTFTRVDTSTLLNQEENWLLLALRIPSLEAFDTTLNFHAMVTTNYTGAMLCHLIKIRQENLPSSAIILFTDPSKYADTLVHCDQSLYELGFEGGKRTLPGEGSSQFRVHQ